MKIEFNSIMIEKGDLGVESTLPIIDNQLNIQNNRRSNLGPYENQFIGYGYVPNAYPYTYQDNYNTKLSSHQEEVVILENDLIKATFLKNYGGRLWSLYDKVNNKELLYVNDVLKQANLAVRNAWFSGGVEWNIGFIGHHPFTCSPLNIAVINDQELGKVLRFYQHERVRNIAYQIDFFLDKIVPRLYSRVSIHNNNDDVVPMYWYTNMAVPENHNGRIIVPTTKAYTSSNVTSYISKVNTLENEDGLDVTFYHNTKMPVDYFFDIDKHELKYIFNANKDGAGLLHFSSESLEGRKLFSWGHIDGSETWQNYLNKAAGNYIEIQAGITKTQYGCMPMPAHTTWEFIEAFQWDCIDDYNSIVEYEDLIAVMNSKVKKYTDDINIDALLLNTRKMACTKGDTIFSAPSYGIIENTIRNRDHQKSLSDHLDFNASPQQIPYLKIIKGDYTSKLVDYTMYINQEKEANILLNYLDKVSDDYIASYILGVYYISINNYEDALLHLNKSINICSTYYNHYAKGVVLFNINNISSSITEFKKAIAINNTNPSLIKAIFSIIKDCNKGLSLIECYDLLCEDLKNNGRIKLLYCYSCILQDKADIVKSILDDKDNILVVDDIREGEELFSKVYAMYQELINENNPLPKYYNFEMK